MPVMFVDGIRKPYSHLVSKVEDGFTYLPWMAALALAERPVIEIVRDAAGRPFHVPFPSHNEAMVMVRSGKQTVLMPVRDAAGSTVKADAMNALQVNNAVSRATAKLCAIAHGIGLGLWLDGLETPSGLLSDLGVTPSSVLHEVAPLVKKTAHGYPYVPWVAAWASARIVGAIEAFSVDPVPVPISDTWSVAVTLHGNGASQTFLYPILGEMIDETGKASLMPLVDPNIDDMNRACMRAVARGVAMMTGYGMSVYADEDREAINVRPIQRRQSTDRTFRVPKTTAEAHKASDLHERHGLSEHLERVASKASSMTEAERFECVNAIRDRVRLSNKGAVLSDAQMIEQLNAFYANSPAHENGSPLINLDAYDVPSHALSFFDLSSADLLRIRAVIG